MVISVFPVTKTHWDRAFAILGIQSQGWTPEVLCLGLYCRPDKQGGSL